MTPSQPAAALFDAFVAQDAAAAIGVIDAVKRSGVPQDKLFDQLFVPAMALLGAAWADGTIDEIGFTQSAVTAEQVTTFVTPPSLAVDRGVTVVIGCAEGDRHDTAKNVIAAALKEAGYRVIDLGVDTRPAEFLEKVESTSARIVMVCAEMTDTARGVGRVREMLQAAGYDQVLMLVAGGPFEADAETAKRSGANGVIKGAESALRILDRVSADLAAGGGS
jgi:methylmalonyl-CoA mutase cobalamin-binding domain/chain